MALRRIRLYPDPVLRVACAPVERFDEELARLVDDMVETMVAAPGVGLAASQIGVERRVAVVDLSAGSEPGALHVLVNPRVLTADAETWTETEGCLSLPGIMEKVDRPLRIRVAAQDVHGAPFELEAEEWLARAILHEVDHLDGVLFTDRLRGLRKDRAKRLLRRLAESREGPE